MSEIIQKKSGAVFIIIDKDKCRRMEYVLYLSLIHISAEENKTIGIWGHRHLRYLKQHRKVFYTNLLTSGRLNGYLADIDKQAEDMFLRLAKQMAEREGVTEQLKAENQMEWVCRMNNIRSRAMEIVNADLIFNE